MPRPDDDFTQEDLDDEEDGMVKVARASLGDVSVTHRSRVLPRSSNPAKQDAVAVRRDAQRRALARCRQKLKDPPEWYV